MTITLFCCLALFVSCGEKPVACLSSNPTAKLNQVVAVQSCSSNFDANQWTVEGGGEQIVGGGDYCDNYINVRFSTTGEKTIKLIAWKFKKKSKATCAEGLNSGRVDETSYKVTIE